MGSLLGSILANFFLEYREEQFCSLNITKPKLYLSHIDIFDNDCTYEHFLNVPNLQHPHLKFTIEKASD